MADQKTTPGTSEAAYVKPENDKEEDEQFLADNIHYKGIFVTVLKNYERRHSKLKVSSFTHKHIECYVLSSNARFVVLKKRIDGKCLYLSQNSIKDVEEI